MANLKRRAFLRTTAAAGAAAWLGFDGYAEKKALAANNTNAVDRDAFGGWKGKQFESTGFFRTEHDGKRWWLVTPEGNAFVSFGVNHYHAGWWIQAYNREHWVKAFGAKRHLDAAWRKSFCDTALADCRRLGLNTLGIHTGDVLLAPPYGPILPYVRRYEPVVLSHYKNPTPETFVDLFGPPFVAQCDAVARKMAAPFADDPMLLGYCMADVPIFTDRDARWHESTTWPRVLRNLGADAPGKRAYMLCIRDRHADIAAFNAVYGTGFATWNELASARDWRTETDMPNGTELDDNLAFLLVCVDKYYAVAKAALRRVDANHLFFGDKLNANSDALESVVEVTSRHTDVVSFQYYARWKDQEALLNRVSSKAKRPFLNGDSSYAVPSEMAPAPHGTAKMAAKDQAERAAWTREFCEGLFARPDAVGWHMCGVIETWKTMKGKEKSQHAGIMTPTGEFYPEMVAAIQDISARMYRIATA